MQHVVMRYENNEIYIGSVFLCTWDVVSMCRSWRSLRASFVTGCVVLVDIWRCIVLLRPEGGTLADRCDSDGFVCRRRALLAQSYS